MIKKCLSALLFIVLPLVAVGEPVRFHCTFVSEPAPVDTDKPQTGIQDPYALAVAAAAAEAPYKLMPMVITADEETREVTLTKNWQVDFRTYGAPPAKAEGLFSAESITFWRVDEVPSFGDAGTVKVLTTYEIDRRTLELSRGSATDQSDGGEWTTTQVLEKVADCLIR